MILVTWLLAYFIDGTPQIEVLGPWFNTMVVAMWFTFCWALSKAGTTTFAVQQPQQEDREE